MEQLPRPGIHGFRLPPEWLGFIASTIKCVPVMPAEAGIHITDQHAVASEVSSDSDLDSGFRQNDGDSLKRESIMPGLA